MAEAGKSKLRKWLLRIGWGLAGLLVAAVAVRVSAGWYAQSRFEAKVEELRARGVPVTRTDLAMEPSADNDNAAAWYLRAALRWERVEDKYDNESFAIGVDGKAPPKMTLSRLIRSEKRWSPEQREFAHAIIYDAGDLWCDINAGGWAGKWWCRTPANVWGFRPDAQTVRMVEKGWAWVLRDRESRGPGEVEAWEWRDHLEELGRYMDLSSRMSLEDNEAHGAAVDCWLWLLMARAFDNAPTLALGMAAATQEPRALHRLVDALEAGEVDGDLLLHASEALGDPESRAWGVGAVRVFRVAYLEAFRLYAGMPGSEKEALFSSKLRKGADRNSRWATFRDGRWGLDRFDRYEASVNPPPWQSTAERAALAKELKELPPAGYPFSLTFWTLQIDWPQLIDQIQTLRVLVKTEIALRRYRLANGGYPETLAALEPKFIDKVPKDPFTGKDLVYRREGAGFVLYSVGPEGANEGKTREPGSNGLTIRLTR